MIKNTRLAHRRGVKTRIRKKIKGTPERPRLVVYKSLSHLYAQVVDDSQARTLVSCSSRSKDLRESIATLKGQKEKARSIGQHVAKKALEKKITTIVFDRNGYMYHGIVKSLADGAREGGLKF
jgi:large subunit ribosomal protein L18